MPSRPGPARAVRLRSEDQPALNESAVRTGTRRDTSTCAATAISSP